MAVTNRRYLFLAFIFSAIGAIFNLVSLSTEEWISATAVWEGSKGDINYINYGLFQGTYKRNLAFPYIYQITMTCSFKNNACALLCGLDAEERVNLLESLYNGNINESYGMDHCPVIRKTNYIYWEFQNPKPMYNSNTVNKISPKNFINAGFWLYTLIFLTLATLVGLATSILALYNVVANPIAYFLSVRSLMMYNGIAAFSTILYMILWGTLYNLRIFHNLSIYDTIVESLNSDKTAYLGYSYWLGFIPISFYIGSIGIVFYREYLNEHDPKQQRVSLDAEHSDPNLYLY